MEKPINILISEFLFNSDITPEVRKSQKWVLEKFVTWMVKNKIDVTNPRRADIIHYKNSLISDGLKPTTIGAYLGPVKRFFRWVELMKYGEDCAAAINAPKDHRKFRRYYLTVEQIKQILDLIPVNTIAGLRDYAMMSLMFVNALRRIEIQRLKVGDINWLDDRIVLYVQRKGRIDHEPILLLPEVYTPIKEYLHKRDVQSNDEPLFKNHSQHKKDNLSTTIISRIVKGYIRKVSDSPEITCHSLRHSAAVNLFRAGHSIDDVQAMLGHSRSATSEAYLQAMKMEDRFYNPGAISLAKLYGLDQKNSKKMNENDPNNLQK